MKAFVEWRRAAGPRHRLRLWSAFWLALAVISAIPIASTAYDRLVEVNQQSRARLITQHRLWELQPEYRGKPEMWTRFASRLLTDRQLMMRVATRYGALAAEIELDYRRDLTIAQSVVVLRALAAWALPLAVLYGLACAATRRRRSTPPVKVQPASVSDPRYMPSPERPRSNASPIEQNGAGA